MLIIRCIDMRTFLRTAGLALLLAEIPLLLLDTEKAGPAVCRIPREATQQPGAGGVESVNIMLLVMALSLLYVVMGTLLTPWVYNLFAQRFVALSLTLQPDGSTLRLRRARVA